MQACLESLVDQTLDSSCYEIIVVDNNSTDNTVDMVGQFAEKYPNVKLLSELSQGASQARNRGWREASGKYVAFIDDDAKATPDWLERVVDAFETVTPKPVVVGGEIHPYYNEKMPSWFTDDLEIRTWGQKKGFLEGIRAPFGFSESNISFQKEVIDKYGGFSSQFGKVGSNYLMGEGGHLCQIIYPKEPYFWYDPAIKVYHYTPRRNARLCWRLKRQYRCGKARATIINRCFFSRENFNAWMKFIPWALKVPYIMLRVRDKSESVKLLQAVSFELGILFGTGSSPFADE